MDASEAAEQSRKIAEKAQEEERLREQERLRTEEYEAAVAPGKNLRIAQQNIAEASEDGKFRARADIGYKLTRQTLEQQGYRLYPQPIDGAPYHHWIFWGPTTAAETELIKKIYKETKASSESGWYDRNRWKVANVLFFAIIAWIVYVFWW